MCGQDGSNSALSPVVHGDIVLSVNTQYYKYDISTKVLIDNGFQCHY